MICPLKKYNITRSNEAMIKARIFLTFTYIHTSMKNRKSKQNKTIQ